MNAALLINHFALPALACATLLTTGCSGKNAPQDRRMTNGVPLALADELQNRNDGKWYWRDTSNLFAGIEIRHHPSGLVMQQLPMTNGGGGPVEPALDTIAKRKQEDYISQNLVDPGATIAEGYVGKVVTHAADGCAVEAARVGGCDDLHYDAQVRRRYWVN